MSDQENKVRRTVSMAGQVKSSAGEPISGASVLAMNTTDLAQQHGGTSDIDGRFTLEVPEGLYDLAAYAPGFDVIILYGVVAKEGTTKNVIMNPSESTSQDVRGVAFLPDGSPAGGWRVELLDAVSMKSEMSTVTDGGGRFHLGGPISGYHILRLTGSASGGPQAYPLPMPLHSSLNVEVALLGARPELEMLRLTGVKQEFQESQSFQVCKVGFKHFNFTDGLMPPGSRMFINGTPMSLNVYSMENSGGLYRYTIYVDCRQNPFRTLPPYPAQYFFFDQTNDRYSLVVFLASLHSVSYNSGSPDIKLIVIQGLGIPGNYWESAPPCS